MKKPPFLKVVIEVIVNFFVNGNSIGLKKIRPFAIVVLCIVLTILLFLIEPSSLDSLIKFIVSLF